MSSQEPNQIFGRKAAMVLGGAFLVGFAILSSLAALDRRDRPTLERLDEPSAAGDPAVYQLPIPSVEGEDVPVPQEPILVHGGVALFFKDVETHSDGALRKAGLDDAGKIPLYRRVREGKLREQIYLKLGPGRYLQLSSKKRGSKAKEARPAESAEATGFVAEPIDKPQPAEKGTDTAD